MFQVPATSARFFVTLNSQREWVSTRLTGEVEEYISRPAPGIPQMRTAVRPRPQESVSSVVSKLPTGVSVWL